MKQSTEQKFKQACVAFYSAMWAGYLVLNTMWICSSCKTDDIIPIPFPTTTTTTIQETQLGLPYIITKHIELVSVSGSGIVVKGDARKDWQNDGSCDGESHVYILRGGKWVGGKFDHQRIAKAGVPAAIREWKNIYGGYGNWKNITPKPTTDDEAVFIVVSYDHAQSTDAIKFKWPTNGE